MLSATPPRVLCLARALRHFSSPPSPTPLTAIRAEADAAWETLIDADWVDNPQSEHLTDRVADIVDAYRPLYDGDVGGGEAKAAYDAVARLYSAGEAMKLCDLYTDHYSIQMRDHMDMVGSLGNKTDITPAVQAKAEESLVEYVNFINAIEDVRVRRKTETQLSRKVLQLRQALSIPDFSDRFGLVMATDRLVLTKAPAAKREQEAVVV